MLLRHWNNIWILLDRCRPCYKISFYFVGILDLLIRKKYFRVSKLNWLIKPYKSESWGFPQCVWRWSIIQFDWIYSIHKPNFLQRVNKQFCKDIEGVCLQGSSIIYRQGLFVNTSPIIHTWTIYLLFISCWS